MGSEAAEEHDVLGLARRVAVLAVLGLVVVGIGVALLRGAWIRDPSPHRTYTYKDGHGFEPWRPDVRWWVWVGIVVAWTVAGWLLLRRAGDVVWALTRRLVVLAGLAGVLVGLVVDATRPDAAAGDWLNYAPDGLTTSVPDLSQGHPVRVAIVAAVSIVVWLAAVVVLLVRRPRSSPVPEG